MILPRASSFSENRNAGGRCRQVLADSASFLILPRRSSSITSRLDGLRAGRLDVEVILASRGMNTQSPSIVSEVLYRDERVVATNKNHPLAKPKSVSLERLTEYPFITQSRISHMRRVLGRLYADAGIIPKISMELENEEAIEPMIAIHKGVALISRCRPVSDHLHSLRTEKRIYCDVTLVYISREYIQRAVRELIRLCYTFCSSRPQA
jgi:DNA-binding transcriptional LysR family regulator